MEQARTFCNGIKEYAEALGKDDFFLVAEIAGGNSPQDRYFDVTGRNLNACLDIGEQRMTVCGVAKGLQSAGDYFAGFSYYDAGMGSHRNYGSQHLSISNDHDHVCGEKTRFSADASNDHQAAAAVALQLFTLGIPCIYYGMEQGLAGGALPQERGYLSNWGGNDCFLRETLFGPHGTSGHHVFNPAHPIYSRIAKMAAIRTAYKPLRRGRQYQREISVCGGSFYHHGAGELAAWSRIFDDQEIIVVVNTHGTDRRGGRITVDSRLSADGMSVLLCTDPDAPVTMQAGAHLPAAAADGRLILSFENWLLGPSEVLICANSSAVEAAVRR